MNSKAISRCFLAAWALGAAALGLSAQSTIAAEPIRIAIGPYLPTEADSRKAYEPFAKYLGEKLGRPYQLTTVTEWSGVIVGLTSKRVDVAWMGPWSYVLARKEGGAEPIATVKYDGRPTYQALILARKGLGLKNFPQDAKGLRLGLSDVGGTSGWLIPTWHLKQQGIDPKTFFTYRDGATNTANLLAVSNGQLDLTSSYDRFRDALISRKIVAADASEIVWETTLPNDAIVVRSGLDPALKTMLQEALVGLDEKQAEKILPPHYTGFAKADVSTYEFIERAGRDVGMLK